MLSVGKAAFVRKPSIARVQQQAKDVVKFISNLKDSTQARHCNDLLEAGQRVSGVYTIFPTSDDDTGKTVYCDMDSDGGGWTVIQKRGQFGNPVYHFYRNWTDYAEGFGDPSQEYWIGNNVLHALTSGPEKMALRVVLTNHSGESVSVDYESMQVGSEAQLFTLTLGKHLGPPGWDSLTDSNHCKFSTFDRDNDGDSGHCATKFHGAWWYSSCYIAHLNGLNLDGPHPKSAGGIDWGTRGGSTRLYSYSYPQVRMMIRPVAS